MAVKVGINGFGRIGRNVFRASMKNTAVEIVGINDITDTKTLAHLLKHDSVLGNLSVDVKAEKDALSVAGNDLKVFAERDPAQIPWGSVGTQIVVESTGLFTKSDDASKHLRDSVKKVIISAPAKGEDLTVVLGVNEEQYDPTSHAIVSNASCTTNCLAPVTKVLHDSFGISKATMTTIHSYTNDQRTLDLPHSDLRRARAAALNMIPTSTGAAKAIGLVMPDLAGKCDGFSIRVPTPNVSVVDVVAVLNKVTTVEEINMALKKAADSGPLVNILGYTEEPLVSSDFLRDPRSSVVDATMTRVLDGNLVKVLTWYDNEWGYSNRVVDLALMMSQKGLN
ncbi:MAG: type I glyceraldehyde-3-phosphate dehydrogenase [Solibacterales bacterium]|nr:type I glyceraldehyde-3-phosphate dehydrogenase [Bryobacterales bacterium]|tara:strand:- start:964 stop:1977 length:1014 start_codon:yes stop_codon:yes gene_type:complete